MMYGTRKELNSKLKRMFGNDERFALLVWTKQDVMSLTQAMTEVEADAILREIGRKGMGEHTGDGISDSTVQALYAGLRTEIPAVSVPADLLTRVTSLTGTGAVMLRTGPAALSLPGPFGAAGFHPTVATSTAGLLRPFRSRRPWRAVSCAFRTPAVRRNAVSRAASRRCGGFLLISASGAVTRLSPCRRGLIQPQPAALAVQGEMNSPQNFLP